MLLEPIVKYLSEIDMYKLSMGQAILHQFSTHDTEWSFECRNEDVHFTPEMVQEIRDQIKHLCTLRFTEPELAYISTIPWLSKGYIDHLRRWYARYEDYTIECTPDNKLSLEIKGSWLDASMYEIYTLYIINEVYFRMAHDYNHLIKVYAEKLDEKVSWLERAGKYHISKFSDFGLRRRLSFEAQDMAIKRLANANYCSSTFIGTSNVYQAWKNGLTPVGTLAHEYPMCVGQGDYRYNPAYSNYFAMASWVKEYGVLNGIALTDTLGSDLFLLDFDHVFATLHKGVRHDSGDPFEWGEKFIHHYEKLGIDPKTKTLLFSDSLNFQKADELFRYFGKFADVAFGIGTFITNDTDVDPLNIVLKVTKCNGHDVAKLSDSPGKCMCKNDEYIAYLQRSIKWRFEHDRRVA